MYIYIKTKQDNVMDPKEFRQFVIKCAEEIIFEGVDLDEKKKNLKQPNPSKLTKPSHTKKDVDKLPKAPETVSVSEEKDTIKESEEIFFTPDKIKMLAEEMKKINKKIDLRNPLINPELFNIISENNSIVKEDQKRWKNLYNYEIPKDESR